MGGPPPVTNLRHVVARLDDVATMLLEHPTAVEWQVGRGGDNSEHLDTPNHVEKEMEAVDVAQHRHDERRDGRSLYLVHAYVQVRVIATAIHEPVEQQRVAVERED